MNPALCNVAARDVGSGESDGVKNRDAGQFTGSAGLPLDLLDDRRRFFFPKLPRDLAFGFPVRGSPCRAKLLLIFKIVDADNDAVDFEVEFRNLVFHFLKVFELKWLGRNVRERPAGPDTSGNVRFRFCRADWPGLRCRTR